jgi:aminoglycoside phosphotransferase
MDALLRAVAAHSADLGVAAPCSGLVVGIDRDPAAKVTVLLFDVAGRTSAVAKVARRRSADGPLRAEHAALTAMASARLPRVREQIPRSLLLQHVADRTVLVTSAVPGGSMMVRYHTPGHVGSASVVAGDLRAASEWLAAFQQDTAAGTVGLQEAVRTYCLPALDRYREEFGHDPVERRIRARTQWLASRMARVAVPLCAVHGDYALGNVLVQDGPGGPRVSGVVDWELGQPCGPAFTDLFKFAASYGSFLDRAAAARGSGLRGHPGWGRTRASLGQPNPWPNLVGFLYAFQGTGWFPDLVRGYLHAGYRRMGVPAQVQEVFLPAFVAQQATTLSDPGYRRGYRDLLGVLAEGTAEPSRTPADPVPPAAASADTDNAAVPARAGDRR